LKYISLDDGLAAFISFRYDCCKASGKKHMATVKDLIEDWIEIRSTLQRQLEMLESGQMQMGTHLSDNTKREAIVRIKTSIGELNALLKGYARA